MLGLGAAGRRLHEDDAESAVSQIIGCDRKGAISTERQDYAEGSMNPDKSWFAENTNPEKLARRPEDVIEGCDLFLGVSGPGIIETESLAKMDDDSIVFAMANPNPEVMPEGGVATCGSWPRAARTTRTRSTTCSASPGSSVALSTPARRKITRR